MLRRCLIGLFLAFLLASCNLPAGGDLLQRTTAAPTREAQPQEPEATVTPIQLTLTVPVDELIATPVTVEAEASPSAEGPAGTETPDEIAAPDETSPSVGAAIEAESAASTRYTVQPGTPVMTANIARPEAGCNWTGVAGQVFGPDGRPAEGLVVEVSGRLGGEEILALGLTGVAPALGPGGYAITLADKAIPSQGTLRAQVLDLNGAVLSAEIPFNTSGSCETNLTLINFVPAGPLFEYYFPFIGEE